MLSCSIYHLCFIVVAWHFPLRSYARKSFVFYLLNATIWFLVSHYGFFTPLSTLLSIINTLCWVVKLSPGLQSEQIFLSDFLIRHKHIWEQATPLLYVIRCSSLFLKHVLVLVRSKGRKKSRMDKPSTFISHRSCPCANPQNLSKHSLHALIKKYSNGISWIKPSNS